MLWSVIANTPAPVNPQLLVEADEFRCDSEGVFFYTATQDGQLELVAYFNDPIVVKKASPQD